MKSNFLSLLGVLCVAAVGALVADAFTTLALFVVLTPLTLLVTGYLGLNMAMLSDGYPKSKVSFAAIYTAMFGPTLGTLAINIGAMFLAHAMTGPTFWVPLAAAAANALFTVGITSLAGVAVEAFR
ncbi:hypothetical protein ACIRG5_41345 [Lentzea sp. NPDC102401]|uniref:hypothetical protein n=1 Tax=Lentzea sp. NPDC102401 TaxID=3364128 RepID=UPI00381DED44